MAACLAPNLVRTERGVRKMAFADGAREASATVPPSGALSFAMWTNW